MNQVAVAVPVEDMTTFSSENRLFIHRFQKIDCGKLKMFTINPQETTTIAITKLIANKPVREKMDS